MPDRIDKLRALVDTALEDATIPWWEWNIPANRVTFNKLKVTMLGYPLEDFTGCGYQTFTSLLHPEDYERTMQAMRDHLEGRVPIYEVDYRIKRADNTYTWYMDRGLTIKRDEEGRPACLRGVVLDLGPDFSAAVGRKQLVNAVRRNIPSGTSEASIPLCAVCLRLRADDQTWLTMDPHTVDNLHVMVSHGICSDCIRQLYPKDADDILADMNSDAF